MIDWIGAWLAERLVFWIPFVLSLSVHEYAHAVAASSLGDDTAEAQGRLTLDPFEHLDMVGTVLLPFLAGVPIGWAKPVPVNPAKFRGGGDGRFGMLLTAAAGPLSNVVLALLCTLGLAGLGRVAPSVAEGALGHVLATTVLLNVLLAVFNLLPLPPLDGSRIVDWLCPAWLRPLWEQLYARAGIGIALVLILPAILGVDVVGYAHAIGQVLVDVALG